MAGVKSQGVVITMTVGATPTVITNVTSFDGPSGTATTIDATTLASTAKEKMMGLPDEGQFTFEFNYDPNSTAHKALIDARAAQSLADWEVDFNGTDTASFSGYVTAFSVKGAVDDLISASATVEISGAVTWPTVA